MSIRRTSVRGWLLGIVCAVGASGIAYADTNTCHASWYGPKFHGNTMANGDRFDMNDPSVVAHKSLPFGTRIRMTNLNNGKTSLGVVQDRGPYVRGRCLDLSKAGAARLGFLNAGTTTIQFQVVR